MVNAEAGGPDRVRELSSWLQEETDLRGRIRPAGSPPGGGTPGPVTGALEITLGSGGELATVAAVVVAWLRTRTGEVSVRLADGDREIEVNAPGLRNLDHAQVDGVTERVVQTFQRVGAR
ncbi:hypothetical protein [Planomonospora sp. ID82291]|uniref:effector-associated constant component EACC1 n=1 Tax=Planomonospora sp. ID82291 TaxID=2738136 RepID=UPI0018C42586|nr:hypothetical protein [Planomonospora sp. ID82291]MBG0815670.1 hypothetical protein [Planomonospora sp. ID82291]